ncbi:TetR/AcrR family transcriptional regulator [Staphylococcus pragensis]|uniref:TetR/AcrR family transcriptional regulator n=1 Tax=Staphylococcus pragensis TaxID=1611836 RepID=A0A4Z1C3S8_9STAP|nr:MULTISPECIES: TetR/AcrR family transcriptional regulator [Staphylococcus]RTX91930.1 TetR/AcrR family transcriptional regulator [Staphylococcus carnosus]TGN26991.1 TetR/AcrR family transcriptional regulator [Staphylococcus pragensis]GGG94423.1 transcriptional regulator [Staphylococcus pragensis]
MDKRQIRTNDYLKKGITKLLNEVDYSDITIQQLANASNINRSTFYLHYKSKDQFLNSMIEDTIYEMIEYVKKGEAKGDEIFNTEFKISFYRLLEYIEMNFDFVKVLIQNMNTTYFRALLVEKVREHIYYPLLEKNNVELDFEKDIILNYTIHGHIGVIERWMNSEMHYSSHYIANILVNISKNSTHELLNIQSEIE